MEHHIPIFGMGGSKLFEHLEVGSSDVGAWVWTKNLVLLDMSVHCTPRVRNTKVYSKTITTLGIIKQQHHTLKQFGPSDQLVLIFYQKNFLAHWLWIREWNLVDKLVYCIPRDGEKIVVEVICVSLVVFLHPHWSKKQPFSALFGV